MSTTDLTSILIQLQTYRENLATELDIIPPNVRPSFEILRREAKENIASLTKEYGERLFLTSIVFWASGPEDKVAEFVKVAVHEAPSMIVVDADAMYNALAEKIWPSMEYRGQFTMDCFSTLVRELRYIAMDLGITEILSPRYGEPFACSTKAELAEYVTKLVRDAMGDELNKLYLRQQIVEKAIEAEHTETLPVILVNASKDEADALASLFKVFAPVFIETGSKITPDFAIGIFRKYSKKPSAQPPAQKPEKSKAKAKSKAPKPEDTTEEVIEETDDETDETNE